MGTWPAERADGETRCRSVAPVRPANERDETRKKKIESHKAQQRQKQRKTKKKEPMRRPVRRCLAQKADGYS